jgi:broad specificity phosphatase PhoE
MDVYLMRHGETDGNVARRHQHPRTQLNEVGKEQVRVAAYEISTLKPTHIISSTQLRAVETTKIINEYCEGVIPDTNPAFEELKRPDWMVGSRYASLSTIWYVWLWFHNKKQDDGETYDDFLKRIIEARSYLESLPSDSRVVVVSHAVFTNIFLEHLCSDKPMSFWRAAKRFWLVLRIRNATILHLKYDKTEKGTCGWQFMSAMRVYQK